MQFVHFRRREFITMLGSAAALVPLTARAQEVGRDYRVGGLSPSPRDAPHYVALFDELRRLGFIESQNLNVDGRGYGVRNDQFVEIAMELVKAKVDAIFCAGDVAIRAAQRATATIPILAVTDDMVGSGLVRSLANPGGNTTGVSILATELDGKVYVVMNSHLAPDFEVVKASTLQTVIRSFETSVRANTRSRPS